MKKYICSFFIVFFFILLGAVTLVKGESKDELTKLVVAIPFFGVPEEDIKLIQEKINEITEKEIHVTVEFPILSSYYDDVTMKISTNEQIDIMLAGYGSFMECYADQKLLPLDDLLEKYGKDIIQQVGKEKIDCCKIYDVVYGIPVNGNYAQQYNCYAMRKDILEKYNLHPEEIKQYDDLEKVFEIVHREEPNMTVLISGTGSMLSNQYFLDVSQGIPIVVHMREGREETPVCIFKSKEYKKALKRVRRWYLKGYINEDIYGEVKSRDERIRNEEIFAYTCKRSEIKDNDIITVGDVEMVRISLDKNILNYKGYSSMPYVITKNSASPEAAMKLLNLLYSNEDVENLLCYGVEGIHYKKMKDGHITYADEKRKNPFLNNAKNMPNQFITYLWEGMDFDYWDEIKQQNEMAVQSKGMGFNFDYTNVDAEYREIVNLYDKYYNWFLDNGIVNPKTTRKKMVKEMKEIGLELVLKEYEKQYEAWNNEQVERRNYR